MRRTLAPTLLLAFLTALPLAAAQAPLLEDPADDLAATIGGTVPAPQAGTWTALDLLALHLVEDPGGFHVEVQLKDLGDDGPRSDYGSIQVRLAFQDCVFLVNMFRSQDNAAYFGSLYRIQGQSGGVVRGLRVDRDLAGDRVWVEVDRFDLACADGRVPQRGDVFEDIRVLTYAALPGVLGSGVARVGDNMPDAADQAATLAVRFGGGDAQGARLATPTPFRVSNGEAATYRYDLTATHLGDKDARYRVFVENVPAGWNVTLPGELLEVPAGQPVAFPLYVTTVFRHQHGSAESFQVHLHEVDGDRWASLDLGVSFLAVAQPSGHHPRLHLHSNDWSGTAAVVNAPLGSTGGYLTMNTLEEDPSDTRKPNIGRSEILGLNTGIGPAAATVARFHWSACLEPALHLGLDADLGREGTMEVPVSVTRPVPGARLTGRLLHLGPGDALQWCFPSEYQDRATTVLAELDFGTRDLAANSKATYTAAVRMTPAADHIAAQEGALLVLELTLEGAGAPVGGAAGANLEPGAWMELPLNEYRDPVAITIPEQGEAPVAGFVEPKAQAKDAPAPAVPILLGLLALAAFTRRR